MAKRKRRKKNPGGSLVGAAVGATGLGLGWFIAGSPMFVPFPNYGGWASLGTAALAGGVGGYLLWP